MKNVCPNCHTMPKHLGDITICSNSKRTKVHFDCYFQNKNIKHWIIDKDPSQDYFWHIAVFNGNSIVRLIKSNETKYYRYNVVQMFRYDGKYSPSQNDIIYNKYSSLVTFL